MEKCFVTSPFLHRDKTHRASAAGLVFRQILDCEHHAEIIRPEHEREDTLPETEMQEPDGE